MTEYRKPLNIGKQFIAKLVELAAKAVHNKWWNNKIAAHWKYGPVTNRETMEHEDMIPFEHLTKEKQAMDADSAEVTINELLTNGYVIITIEEYNLLRSTVMKIHGLVNTTVGDVEVFDNQRKD